MFKELFNFTGQPQKEAGSAEEQPASDKADTYTVIKRQSAMAAFLFTTGKSLWLKKLVICFSCYYSFLVFDTG
jgi:hypothetical protein